MRQTARDRRHAMCGLLRRRYGSGGIHAGVSHPSPSACAAPVTPYAPGSAYPWLRDDCFLRQRHGGADAGVSHRARAARPPPACGAVKFSKKRRQLLEANDLAPRYREAVDRGLDGNVGVVRSYTYELWRIPLVKRYTQSSTDRCLTNHVCH